jgi:hypothetical protein
LFKDKGSDKMACEYESRCLNSSKCYRCFNGALLKLPEDKLKKKNAKTKVYDHKTASADDSWKDLEATVAQKLNNIPTIKDARRSRMSGALWWETGDVVDEILHPECKERKGRELIGGDKSMSIKREWLEKAKRECQSSEKIMVLPFRFKEDENIYAIFDFDDIASLVGYIKAYMMDNDAKNKEIKLLKERLHSYESKQGNQ